MSLTVHGRSRVVCPVTGKIELCIKIVFWCILSSINRTFEFLHKLRYAV